MDKLCNWCVGGGVYETQGVELECRHCNGTGVEPEEDVEYRDLDWEYD